MEIGDAVEIAQTMLRNEIDAIPGRHVSTMLMGFWARTVYEVLPDAIESIEQWKVSNRIDPRIAVILESYGTLKFFYEQHKRIERDKEESKELYEKMKSRDELHDKTISRHKNDLAGLHPTKRLHASLLLKQKGGCAICEIQEWETKKSLHAHRVLPGNLGGMYTEDNVVLVCHLCHMQIHSVMNGGTLENKAHLNRILVLIEKARTA